MPWVTWEEMIALARKVQENFNYITAFGTTFSCADVLGLFVSAMDYCWRQGVWPKKLPVQRLLGPTEEPLSVAAPLRMTRENIFAASLAAYSIMMDERRIPAKLHVSNIDFGPSELLHSLAKFLVETADTGKLPLEVEIPAVPTLPTVVNEPAITERRFGSSKRPAGMDFTHLWDLLKWQSWSYRPAVKRT